MPSSTGFYGAYLDTLGIEFEGIGLSRNTISDVILPNLISEIPEARLVNLTRDASTEFSAEYIPTSLGNLLVSVHTKEAQNLRGMNRGNRQILGYELFTSPMLVPEMEKLMYPLTYALVQAGDFVSDRAATHYHVGFANNLRLLKNLVRVCLTIDPVLLRLGGMGRKFRGHCNLAAYARPLMKSAAVTIGPARPEPSPNLREVIANARRSGRITIPQEEEMLEEFSQPNPRSKGKYAEIINPMAALDASSLTEFWASFGVGYKSGGGTDKYHPSRYTSINFYAIPQHGTIEFRHFNQSHDAYLLIALGKFLRATVEMTTLLDKAEVGFFEPVPSATEISMSDATDIISNIVSICYSKEIENMPTENEVAYLLEVLQESSFQTLPEVPVLTHVRDKFVPEDIVKLGRLNVVKKVLQPKHVDIHNIGDKSVSLLDEMNSQEGG